MVGILLYTLNILLSCSIITNPDARFSQDEATKSSIHASKWSRPDKKMGNWPWQIVLDNAQLDAKNL